MFFQLTHSQENVVDLQWLDSSEVTPGELDAVARNMAMHLRHLLDQREAHLEVHFISCTMFIDCSKRDQHGFMTVHEPVSGTNRDTR